MKNVRRSKGGGGQNSPKKTLSKQSITNTCSNILNVHSLYHDISKIIN
jgi:hypothetical protein